MRRSNLDPDRDFDYQEAGGRAAIDAEIRRRQTYVARQRFPTDEERAARDEVLIMPDDNGDNGSQSDADSQKLAFLRLALIAVALLK